MFSIFTVLIVTEEILQMADVMLCHWPSTLLGSRDSTPIRVRAAGNESLILAGPVERITERKTGTILR